MADLYKDGQNITAPGEGARSVTPNDSEDYLTDSGAVVFRSLYIGGSGNVRILTAEGEDVTFIGVPAGSVLPIRVRRVYSTSTTATSIVGIY